MISMSHLTHRFGNQLALDDVSLSIEKGDRLALVGENGAGKSTLMNVLFGLIRPHSGQVMLDGHVINIHTPQFAMAKGLGMVHQHFTLVPTLSVAENMALGNEPRRGLFFDTSRAIADAQTTCRRLGFELDVQTKVSQLSVGSQQKVEILKALHRGAHTLILDEPTAVLTPQETRDFFRVLDSLSEAGVTLILISHRLTDVLRFARRIAVLRKGKLVAEVPPHTSPEQLAELMVGHSIASSTQREEPSRSAPGPVRLRAEKLCATPLQSLDFHCCAGEMVGFAGVDGNGQSQLEQVLTGLRAKTSGRLFLNEGLLDGLTAAQAHHLGIAHIPEDRLGRGLAGALSGEENISLGLHKRAPFAKRGILQLSARFEQAKALFETADVRPRNPKLAAQFLSGGNQQKLVVARELQSEPALVVVAQPTRGLDFAAESAVHQRLMEARHRGAAVVVFSLDLHELLRLCDRLYTLYRGRITGEFARANFNETAIGQAMLGVSQV
jgi:general nucleoside transport system ATP-binding protein